jgi:hypothetical protein
MEVDKVCNDSITEPGEYRFVIGKFYLIVFVLIDPKIPVSQNKIDAKGILIE